ncbi:Fmn oxidoreductase protein [Marinobacterium lacunae]|uniref:Fmn oxidoreductase protein n=1 Tax=Marinobacterium lacunae TaxID=1232683 RepID=A0A081FY28_9GAMM|nr:alkene reductase [Marinobacterium lacunae]KEA63433.1 Fmn oxidoreductase protein [Marinobacterium lacunae]
MHKSLFDAIQLGDLTLANRMVMAPMTRNRADANGMTTPMMVTHYRERAGAGLIITESTPVSPQAIGYPFTPGLYTDAHVESWRRVTDAVHEEGGHIFIQLQHCGRISHPSFQPDNGLPVGPSAIRPEGQSVTYTGMQDFVTPHALQTNEIRDVVEQFKNSAELAKRAGFDGVEVHGANGYIIDQFLRDGSNHRNDAYGGNVENRMRLLNEILDEVSSVWPAHRVGVRLSPENSFNSMSDSAPQTHFEYFAEQLGRRGLAYLHVLEGDMMTKVSVINYSDFARKYDGVYIANNGYNLESAQESIGNGVADMIAFGVPFLANPDLVRRYKENLSLNDVDASTFYGGDEKGYNDYPIYA